MKKSANFYKSFLILTSFAIAISFQARSVYAVAVDGVPFSKNQNLQILNSNFEEYPSAVLRIELASKTIRDVFEVINKRTGIQLEDRSFAQEQLKKILAPVQQFFDAITAYLPLVKPLVEECYRSHGIDASSAFLTKFFESKKPIKDFCEKEVGSSQELARACNEFLCFFADLNASLSPKARQKSQELLQQLNSKKKELQKK